MSQPPPYDPYRQQQQPAYNPYAQQQQPVYGQPAYAPANPYGPPPTGYAPQPAYGAVPPSQPAYNPAQAFAPVAPGPYEAQGYVSPAPHTGKYQDATEHEARFVAQDGYRDWFWAVFFILHLITLFIAGFVLFGRYKDQLTKGGNDNTNNEVLTGDLYGSIIIFVIISLILCWGWLQIVQKYATQLIYFTLGLSVAIQLFFAIMLFAAGSIAGGIIFLLFAGLSLLYAYLVRTRIAFASIMLETVSKFIQMYPATIYYSIGSSLVQGVWMFVWVLTAASCLYAVDYGDSQKDPNSGKKGSTNGTVGFIYFLLLVSFFWTSQVVKNVVHVTVSGTLASWYFLYPNQMPENPTNKAFKRATTTSFGSICLGSLIIAVIKAIKAMVQQARHSNNDFARACAECLINCIDNLVQYFNLYAFTQVAIYGKTYCEAAKATWDLLKARGFAAIINDDLIGGVMALGALIGALLVGGVGVILGKFVFHYSAWGFFAVVGALIGFGMCVCAMEVVESSVASLFVCYAEDPVALRDTKPETYQRINDAFHNYYGANGPAGQ